MVVLNLRGDCLARTATNFQQGMTDKRFLELEIRAWLHSPARKRQLAAEAYYDGAQDVLHRRRVALDDDGHIKVLDHLPNNRLVNNIYAKMVDQKTNYSFGRPFSFDTEDKGYAKALNSVLGSKFRRVMRNVGEGAWIGGKCWLFPYYEGGELAFKRFPADEVLPFWADADHTVLDAAVHVYAVLEYDETEVAKDIVKVEVMHGGGVDCFILRDDGTLEPDPEARSGPYIIAPDPKTGEEKGYNWERIPLVCFKSSQHEIPLLSKVKCLQDAYNSIVSNFANQMEEDVHSTILVIKNYDGEDLGRVRVNLATYGIIKVRSFEGSEGGVDTLQIEVNVMPGKGSFSLTGQLGDVMKESARTGISYIRSVSKKYAISPDFFEKHDIHVHIPEGAVPKDGPSAGITMAVAMLSAITEKKVRADLAMTGEVTLRGRVLPIGGLKEKLLAAKSAGIKTVLVPKANQADVEELSAEITKGMEILFVESMDEVLKAAMGRKRK